MKTNKRMFVAGAMLIAMVALTGGHGASGSRIHQLDSQEDLATDGGATRGGDQSRLYGLLSSIKTAQYNEPDLATLMGQSIEDTSSKSASSQRQLHPRYLRSAASQPTDLHFDDDLILRSRLPELIAQAHTDKTFERALLRMLINARLRQQQLQPSSGGGWRNDDESAKLVQQQEVGGEQLAGLPRMSARLEQALAEEYANMEPVGVAGQLTNGNELANHESANSIYPAIIGKRNLEYYLKPCSFNAISCAGRNPFRGKGNSK